MKFLLLLLSLLTFHSSFALTLKIGSAPQNPPFSTIADTQGNFFGFDIDIMMEVCRRVDATCRFKPIVLNDLFPAVQNQQIDLAVAAIIIAPELQQDFIFSLPYLGSNAQFLTLNQSDIKRPEDIASKTVGTRKGTLFKNLALSIYPNIKVIEYPQVANLLDGLHKKEVDIILINNESAKYWYANNSDDYRLVGSKIPVGNGYAIMARKGNEGLINQINEALLKMEADGTYLHIFSNYFD